MRATILNNDPLDFEIETIPEERSFSVSSEVVGKKKRSFCVSSKDALSSNMTYLPILYSSFPFHIIPLLYTLFSQYASALEIHSLYIRSTPQEALNLDQLKALRLISEHLLKSDWDTMGKTQSANPYDLAPTAESGEDQFPNPSTPQNTIPGSKRPVGHPLAKQFFLRYRWRMAAKSALPLLQTRMQ